MDNIKYTKALKVKKDNSRIEIDDSVTIEHKLRLVINDKLVRNMVCTNTAIKELIYGHLFTQGYIKNISDIKNIEITDDNKNAKVTLDEKCDLNLFDKIKNLDIVTTGARYIDSEKEEILDSDTTTDIKEVEDESKIMENSKFLLEANELFKITGCLHSAGLAFENVIKYYETDLGRHNAVDKVIGHALINNDDISKAVLYTTGRIPSDMINKVVKAGIKMVVTRAAVTYDAIQIARKHSIRLLGFSRGESINIYT